MLGEIFYWVLNMSILGSAMGLIVLLIRPIKRLPRFVPYMLWAVPLIRLWLPFGFGSKYSLMSLIAKVTTKTVVIYEGGTRLPALYTTNSIMAAAEYFPIVYKTNLLAKVFAIAAFIWVIVAAAALLTAMVLYVLTMSELKTAKHLQGRIFVSDKIVSPAVFGLIRPKIILHEQMGERHKAYILLHEEAHIHRADNLWRIMAVATACLHWFNPLIWIFLKCFFADLELSCDEKVLRQCGEAKKKDYALALLDCESQKTVYTSAFGGAKTRTRIENILSYKKLTAVSGVCFAALLIVVAITLLTNAAQ